MTQPCITHKAWWIAPKEWIEPEPDTEPWDSLPSSPHSIRLMKLQRCTTRSLRVFTRKEAAQRAEAQSRRRLDLLYVGGAALLVLLYFGWGIYVR